jgi:hypothetical protein
MVIVAAVIYAPLIWNRTVKGGDAWNVLNTKIGKGDAWKA